MEDTVYWRYGDDSEYWHLYADCEALRGAAQDGTLCKGRPEVAINTGREKVCPVCKKRSDDVYWKIQKKSGEPVKATAKPLPDVKPAQPPAATKKHLPTITKGQAWAIAIAVALCTWAACALHYGNVYSELEDTAYSHGYSDASALFEEYYNDGYEEGYTNGRIARKNSYVVYITKSGSSYHRDGCSYLKSKIPVDVKDAIANGYTACSRCKP